MAEDSEFPNPYRRQLPYILGFTLLSLALLAVGVSRGPFAVLALILGIVGGSLGLIFSLAWWLTGRGLELQLAAFRKGVHLARWSVPADEWNPFARERNVAAKISAIIISALLALSGVLTGALIHADGDKFGLTLMQWSVVGGLVLWIVLHRAMATWRPRRRPVLVVYGPHAGVFDGRILSWNTFGYQLMGAELDEASGRVLVRTRATQGEHRNVVTLRVPYPRDKVDEARALVTELARYASE
ncbi:MAG: hypothetical protein R3A51_19580 [Nannocystaceae bacterium]|nr:hypothetical protein [Myxococcales bacterium]